MPENIPMLPGARNILTLILLLAGSPSLAQAGGYELFPEPDVRQNATNRTASAYVVDKKSNQFWICTARYDFATFRPITVIAYRCQRISGNPRSVL